MNSADKSPEGVANDFINYLFDKYKGTRHVRRVASWIGLLVLAIDRESDSGCTMHRTRQLEFEYRNRKFRAKFNHLIKRRGGIEIVEVLPRQGAPISAPAVTISSLLEAEQVHRTLGTHLKKFIKSN